MSKQVNAAETPQTTGSIDEELTADEQLEAQANAFGLDTDRLAEFVYMYEEGPAAGVDPLGIFMEKVIDPKVEDDELRPKTRDGYERSFRYWKSHMAAEGRHHACPNEGHVRGFIRRLRDEYGHTPGTIQEEVFHVQRAYKYWQQSNHFPHPADFDPFVDPLETESLGKEGPEKEQHPMTVEQLREVLAGVTHIRDRAIILAQLKLGLRVSEVCNLRLEDVSLVHDDLEGHYPTIGSHPRLAGVQNAVHIAPTRERDGNKSARPRVLPLDDEMRSVLIRYLLIRPDSGEPWLFLTKKNHTRLDPDDKAVNRIWKDAFHPEFAETEQYRPVTSHYGRHRFVTFWRNQGANPEQLKYMRGDDSAEDIDGRDALNKYIHTYYSDIEDVYRENIYKLLA